MNEKQNDSQTISQVLYKPIYFNRVTDSVLIYWQKKTKKKSFNMAENNAKIEQNRTKQH